MTARRRAYDGDLTRATTDRPADHAPALESAMALRALARRLRNRADSAAMNGKQSGQLIAGLRCAANMADADAHKLERTVDGKAKP